MRSSAGRALLGALGTTHVEQQRSGEYLSPAWWTETAYAGDSSAVAPDPHTVTTARAESWLDALYSIDGETAFGFTDELQGLGGG